MNGVVTIQIRYAEDTMMLAETDVAHQNIIEKSQRACSNYGMKINFEKKKTIKKTVNPSKTRFHSISTSKF